MNFGKKNVFEKFRQMKTMFGVSVWCAAMVLSLGTAGCSTKSDYGLIQGAWRIVGKNERCVFTGETMSIEYHDGHTQTSQYKLNPSKTPKTIDFIHREGGEKGHTVVGIYALEGDTLKICWAGSRTVGRPTEFKDIPGADLIELKRE